MPIAQPLDGLAAEHGLALAIVDDDKVVPGTVHLGKTQSHGTARLVAPAKSASRLCGALAARSSQPTRAQVETDGRFELHAAACVAHPATPAGFHRRTIQLRKTAAA